MYKRFIRWASDRLADDGIVAFITNRSYLEARQDDGFRQGGCRRVHRHLRDGPGLGRAAQPQDFGNHPQRLRDTDRSRHRLLCPGQVPAGSNATSTTPAGKMRRLPGTSWLISRETGLGKRPVRQHHARTPRDNWLNQSGQQLREPDTVGRPGQTKLAKSVAEEQAAVFRPVFVGHPETELGMNGYTTSTRTMLLHDKVKSSSPRRTNGKCIGTLSEN